MGTHTDKALAVARLTGWNLDEHAKEHGWGSVGIGPVGQTRDSEPLDASNWRVVVKDLETRFPEGVNVEYFRHFACGWIEELSYDASNPEVCAAVQAWREKLENYPVADEMDMSDLEYERNHPSASECYGDSECCPHLQPHTVAECEHDDPDECPVTHTDE